ncbi:MAG: hypothetical protein ACJAQT_004122 [Akkermansiaceae bacterium]
MGIAGSVDLAVLVLGYGLINQFEVAVEAGRLAVEVAVNELSGAADMDPEGAFTLEAFAKGIDEFCDPGENVEVFGDKPRSLLPDFRTEAVDFVIEKFVQELGPFGGPGDLVVSAELVHEGLFEVGLEDILVAARISVIAGP